MTAIETDEGEGEGAGAGRYSTIQGNREQQRQGMNRRKKTTASRPGRVKISPDAGEDMNRKIVLQLQLRQSRSIRRREVSEKKRKKRKRQAASERTGSRAKWRVQEQQGRTYVSKSVGDKFDDNLLVGRTDGLYLASRKGLVPTRKKKEIGCRGGGAGEAGGGAGGGGKEQEVRASRLALEVRNCPRRHSWRWKQETANVSVWSPRPPLPNYSPVPSFFSPFPPSPLAVPRPVPSRVTSMAILLSASASTLSLLAVNP
eukprot:766856-Hanusia_phi.AAC.3